MSENDKVLAQILTKLDNIEKDIQEIKENYVTKDAFDPVQKLVWAAMLGLIATAIGLIFK